MDILMQIAGAVIVALLVTAFAGYRDKRAAESKAEKVSRVFTPQSR